MIAKPSPTILHIALASPLRHSFDYLLPADINVANLKPGMRITVPLRNKPTLGVLLSISNHTEIPWKKLKSAIAVLDEEPLLTPIILQLAQWASEYYHHPIGEVVLQCLPTWLRQNKKINLNFKESAWEINKVMMPLLNSAQQQAITAILNTTQFQPYLLDGITGSGKTEVYLQVIAELITQKKQALILVPEIGLTPQTVARFAERFAAPIVMLHSGLTDRERAQAWMQAKSGEAAIIIGTRSAIFTPLLNPGIIILDEEHDLSFKQQSGFRYSARDLALIRGQMENVPVILGSATPALESLHNTQRGRYERLCLPQRAGAALNPRMHLIDLRNQKLEEGLSPQLLQVMQQHLQMNNQVLLFLNRRGFAPTLLCHSCGWIAKCKRCDARLTVHQMPRQLFCHHCNGAHAVPTACGDCASKQLLTLGMGTQRLEQMLARYFPSVKVLRIDRDSTRRKHAMEDMLQSIQQGEAQILIGTQMLTKGHHFPDVTLVAIIDADSGLFSQDFRASERLGQLLIQVTGRAGRVKKLGEVYIQTHHPHHPLLQQLIVEGYNNFAQTLLLERQAAQLPPYTYLALLRAEAVTEAMPFTFLGEVANVVRALNIDSIQLLGPIPAIMERKAGRYRAQLLINSSSRKELHQVCKKILPQLEKLTTARKVRWSLDIDPLEMS